MTIRVCTRCWRVSHQSYAACPKCGVPTCWREIALPGGDGQPTDPTVAWEITIQDARFLSSVHIDAELSKT